MTGKLAQEEEVMYTKHGKKRNQGRLIKVGERKALGYFEGDEVVGYTTLEEIFGMASSKELTEYQLDF